MNNKPEKNTVPLILIVDDEEKYRQLYSNTLKQAGFSVILAESAADVRKLLKTYTPDMIISDVKMPGTDGISFLKEIRPEYPNIPFLFVTAFADLRDAVNALKLGAVDYLEKPVDLHELITAVNDALGISANSSDIIIPKELMQDIVVESPAMQEIFNNAYRVAQSEVNVLITGKSGTGKEVLASFIHRASKRSSEPFVAINCAAIPANMLAGELFGHVKGAFTGAYSNREGLFKSADKGTLFLDEIGDMPIELQPAILRAIEAGMISPVGSDKEFKINIRIIAATNKDLTKSIQDGTFREDLFYRLNVIAFELPPLCERCDDILPLAHFFLLKNSLKDKRFSPSTSKKLLSYSWPGNTRELANAIQRAAIISNNDIILPEHLPPMIAKTADNKETVSAFGQSDSVQSMSDVEKEAIRRALEQTNGNKTKAAQLLGISRRAVIYKIKRYELE